MNRINDNYAPVNDLSPSHSRHYSYPIVPRHGLLAQGNKSHDSIEFAKKAAYRRIRIQMAQKQELASAESSPEAEKDDRRPASTPSTTFFRRCMRFLALPIYAMLALAMVWILLAAPGFMAMYFGNEYCERQGCPRHRDPWNNKTILKLSTISVIGAFTTVFPLTLNIIRYFPYKVVLGRLPVRYISHPDRTRTTSQDRPWLIALLPSAYVYSFLACFLAFSHSKLPIDKVPRRRRPLTPAQAAFIAAYGALPVAIFCVVVYPLVCALMQRVHRAFSRWWARMGGNAPAEHHDSIFQMVVHQYAFWARWWRTRRDGRHGYAEFEADTTTYSKLKGLP